MTGRHRLPRPGHPLIPRGAPAPPTPGVPVRRFAVPLCLSAALVLSAAPARAAEPVTPLAPTVTDECGMGSDRVSVPRVPGVRYLVDLDGETIELAPGDWAGIAFLAQGSTEGPDMDLPVVSATICSTCSWKTTTPQVERR